MSRRHIELVIDEVVIHGDVAADPERFRAQLQQELVRVLQSDILATGTTEPTVQSVTAAPGRTPNAVQVARAVARSIQGAITG